MVLTMEFTKEDTKVVKGFAILLMLMHHLWGFPDRIPGDGLLYSFHIFGRSSIQYLGMFGKICVSIFFFIGGYGIYKSAQTQAFDLVGKLKRLYISYWKVFVIFVPLTFGMRSIGLEWGGAMRDIFVAGVDE